MKNPTNPDGGWWGEPKTTSPQPTAAPSGGNVPPATSRLRWPLVCRQIAILRGHQRTDALVLLTLFPPKRAPRERGSWSTYYQATVGQILGSDPVLVGTIEADLRQRLGHSLGLIVNEPLPVPVDWGSQPGHFNAPRTRDGESLTSEQQRAERGRRCREWNIAAPGAIRPRQWGASVEHIARCRWLFSECDRHGMTPADQLALSAVVFGAQPTFSISTGGKSIHCYFRLLEPITPPRFTELQRLVIAAYQHLDQEAAIDSSLSKPNQVMRLAGGFHPRTGVLASIHTASDTLIDAAALEARLKGLLPPPPPPSRVQRPQRSFQAHRGGAVEMDQIREALERIQPYASEQDQRPEFIRFVGGLRAVVLEAGGTDADALALALDHSPGVLDAEAYWRYDWTRITAGSFWYLAGGAPKRVQDLSLIAAARAAAAQAYH